MRNRQPTHEERLLALEMAKLTTRTDAELAAIMAGEALSLPGWPRR